MAKRFLHKFSPFDPEKANIGDMVFIAPLEKEGKIESIDTSNNSALLILGDSIRTRYSFSDLLMPINGQKKKDRSRVHKKTVKENSGQKETGIPHIIQTRYNTIDLRGLKVDEAIQKVEQDFDKMLRNGIPSAVVIHGHGTGALKEAVRNNFKHSFYVRDFRAGEEGEGGDGVSIVLLKD